MKRYFLLFLVFSKTYSQDSLSLNDCLELAFKNNLLIKNALIAQEISNIQSKSKYYAILPNVQLSSGRNTFWGRGIDPLTNSYVEQQFQSSNGGISSGFNVFSGFKNLYEIKLAKQQVEYNKTSLQKIKNDITIEIAGLYTQIQYVSEIIESNKEQILASEKQAEVATLKFKSGLIAESEVFKIKAQIAAEKTELISNENELNTLRLGLKQSLNLTLSAPILLKKPLIRNNIVLPKIDVPFAVQNNPSFVITQYTIEREKLNVQLKKAQFYPSIQFGANLSSSYSGTDQIAGFINQMRNNLSKSIGFNLSFPIFSNFQNRFAIKENVLNYESMKVNSEIESVRLEKVILQAINDVKAAQTKYGSAVEFEFFSQKSYNSDWFKFEQGRISVVELNASKVNLIKAKAELIKTKYDLLFRTALIEFYAGKAFDL